MRRAWRIYRLFVATSLARELEFKANFFAKVGQNAVWALFFTLIVAVLYANTPSVAGWNRGEAFVLAATCFILTAVSGLLFMSLTEIPEHVRRGTLDFVITKPVDSQFWVSLRRTSFDQVGSLLAGALMLGYGIVTGGVSWTPASMAGYLALSVAALAIYYSLNLALMTLGIWFVRVDNLWVLSETIMQVARFPVDIFSVPVQRVFLYFIPFAFLGTVPSLQLVRGFDPGMLALGVFWAGAALVLSRLFWRRALASYSSASS